MTSILPAQVGINTRVPIGAFHIDGAGDNTGVTPSAVQLYNDIVVDNNGNLGLGTIPTAKLHIRKNGVKPAFRLEDGSQFNNAVLTADTNGKGIWQFFSIGSRIVTWKVTRPNVTFPANTDIPCQATTAAELQYTSSLSSGGYTLNSVSVPRGRYIMFFSITMSVPSNNIPFGSTTIYANGSPITSFNMEHRLVYVDTVDFPIASTITANMQLLGNSNNVNGYYVPFITPPYTCPVEISLSLIKLNI